MAAWGTVLLRFDESGIFLDSYPPPSCLPDHPPSAHARPPPPASIPRLPADLVPRQEEVGERVLVPGLPQLQLPLLLRPRLQDTRGV
jgi:hypothetical protein